MKTQERYVEAGAVAIRVRQPGVSFVFPNVPSASCTPRQKSRVELHRAKVETRLIEVTVEFFNRGGAQVQEHDAHAQDLSFVFPRGSA